MLVNGIKKGQHEVSGHGGNSSRYDVSTLEQVPTKTEDISCEHDSDSCIFDLSVSVSVIHMPSIPRRSPQLLCSVPCELPVIGTT